MRSNTNNNEHLLSKTDDITIELTTWS